MNSALDRRVKIHCHLLQSSRCVGSSGRKKERAPMSQEMLDLLQVDLLASGTYLVWPRGGRPRATKSRVRPAPYEIRRRTFLKVLGNVKYIHKSVFRHRPPKFLFGGLRLPQPMFPMAQNKNYAKKRLASLKQSRIKRKR